MVATSRLNAKIDAVMWQWMPRAYTLLEVCSFVDHRIMHLSALRTLQRSGYWHERFPYQRFPKRNRANNRGGRLPAQTLDSPEEESSLSRPAARPTFLARSIMTSPLRDLPWWHYLRQFHTRTR